MAVGWVDEFNGWQQALLMQRDYSQCGTLPRPVLGDDACAH